MKKNIMVARSSMPEFEEYIEEIRDIWDTVWLTNMGSKHKELQQKLSEYLQVPKISLFCNGHMALELTLQAFQLQGQVITTPYSFASTTHAIVRNNLTPVFCDINEDDYTIDADQIESLITPKTSAIVPVHVYGNICDNEKIMDIAKKHNLKVIYDAAHAFHVKENGVSVATYGDASMFSFHATKVFHTIEGGAVASDYEWLHKKLYQLKNFGIEDEETVAEVGANAKMSEFQAAMGICNLRHIDGEIAKRKQVVQQYRTHLDGIPGIKLCPEKDNVTSNYAYFPVVFDKEIIGVDRNQIYEELKRNNIYARKYFYPLINEFGCYRPVYNALETPVAKRIAASVLCLPVYAELELEEVDEICNIILGMTIRNGGRK